MTLTFPTLLAVLLTSGSPERLTLDDALAEAERGNLDLRIARAQLDAADADVVAAWSGVLPRLDVQLSFGHTWDGKTTYVDPRTGEPVPGLTIPAVDFEGYRAGLQLRLPLFEGFRTTREVQRTRAARRANALGVDEAALRTSFEVTRRFLGAVLAARTLDVLERAVGRSEELVARAAALVTGGRGAKADVIQARVDLANDQLAVEGQRLQLAQARSALATSLGRAGDAELDPIPPPALDAPASGDEEVPLDVLVERARAARPELRAQAALVEAAVRAVAAARSGYWPVVSAAGSYSRTGPALREAGAVYDDPRRDYVAEGQVVVAWNLFAGRETSAGVRRAQASLSGAVAAAARADHGVVKEVSDAHVAVRTLSRQIVVAASTVDSARQGLEVARERADAGRATQLEVRDASLKLTHAELTLARVRIEHAIAVADLARATGTPR